MELHEIAKLIRKNKGMNQPEFAELIGWGLEKYRAFEQNKMVGNKYPNPRKSDLETLAIGLGGKLTITLTK
jgi:transcriptional regulator with XRE-family HTH domain